MQKQSFILKVPYFLATKAGSFWVKAVLSSCYLAFAVGHSISGFGTFAAALYSIMVYQVLYYKLKEKKEYKIYLSFLLQRILFYTVFVIGLAIISVEDGYFQASIWNVGYIFISTLSLLDVFYTVKGMVGIGFINANKNNN